MPLVSCHNVSVAAGGRTILNACSFAVDSGSCLGILGPNGAGKSTLLKVCNGLVLPSSGTAACLGQTITPQNARHLRKRIGYVSQFRTMDARQPITVFESVLSGTFGWLGLFKNPGKRERALAMESLDAVAATHLADRPLGHLSGGEAQRIAIARALAQEPELLLLDEPTASLDWQARRDILRLIGTLRHDFSLTVLMVTHELNALPDLCDAVLFLKNGSVTWHGKTADGLTEARLSEAFDTPVTVLSHNRKPVVLV